MATKKPKNASKSKQSAETEKKVSEAVVAEEVKKEEKTAKKPVTLEKVGFFGKKYCGEESVTTIFKDSKFYAALLGEVLGTALLTSVIFALSLMGIANIAMYAFAVAAIILVISAFSGAQMNPIVTVGMMASRRMSVIRGVMYIIAQIVGAWIAWLIFNAFYLGAGDAAYYGTPEMADIAEGQFWVVAMIEALGAFIIAFFFNRAQSFKRSKFTQAAIVTGGICTAILIGYVISAAFYGLSNNFAMNPAIALMMKIFPESGDSFGEVFGGVMQALSAYVIVPMIAGVLGSWCADGLSKLAGEKIWEGKFCSCPDDCDCPRK